MSATSIAPRHVLVVVLSAASMLLAFGASAAVGDSTPAPIPTACTPPIKCCRVCTSGKACGNTCIADSKSCKKGKGCACDAADVCAEDP
jgi:hypothetical protein